MAKVLVKIENQYKFLIKGQLFFEGKTKLFQAANMLHSIASIGYMLK